MANENLKKIISADGIFKHFSDGEHFGDPFNPKEQYLVIYSCSQHERNMSNYDFVIIDKNQKIVGIGRERGREGGITSYLDKKVSKKTLSELRGILNTLEYDLEEETNNG